MLVTEDARWYLLDRVIDTLADWIDSAKTLTNPTDYRAHKRDELELLEQRGEWEELHSVS